MKIRVKIFLKCPFWSITAKLENIWTKFFLQEVVQESCGWKSICQIFIQPLWLVTPAFFLVKIFQILQKVIAFFPERGEEIKISFWHIWIAQWLKFIRTIAYFFYFGQLSGGKKGQSWSKSAKFGSVPFHKYSNLSKKFCSYWNFGNVGSYLGSNYQKGLFRGCWMGTQNFGNF